MLRGKIEIQNRISVENAFDENKGTLGLIYTPGVAYVATEISNNKELSYDFTSKWNNVAIVCDGTRVLGLGNIGPEGALPVMEGKSVLFKILGGINAYPLCIATQDKEEIIKFVKMIEPIFGAINIEDIESPKVLEIVDRLHKELQIPVFHDDQHGTAVITLSALINALRLVRKDLNNIRVVIAGAGSAGYGIFRILWKAGCKNIVVVDSRGAIYQNRTKGIDSPYKQDIVEKSNPMKLNGTLGDVLKGSDVFIGVSGRGQLIDKELVQSMNSNPIVFALSNPDPEILPPDALEAGASIVATGRSDFANQVNNAVVFPAIMRSLLDLRVKGLDEDMLVSVAYAIANIVDTDHLKNEYIIPKVNDPRIISIVTATLKEAMKKHIESKKHL
jgi:malate dehydrogenase (oxaloacetate-decarboxylating)